MILKDETPIVMLNVGQFKELLIEAFEDIIRSEITSHNKK